MAMTYNKKIDCPVCNETFEVEKLRRSKLQFISRDPDFCPYYEGTNPIYYGVYVCPYCGYAAYESQFKSVTTPEISIIKEKITSRWQEQDLNSNRDIKIALAVYKILLLNLQVIESPSKEIAKTCLRIAWLYRFLEDHEEEKKYLVNAKKLYEKAYSKEADFSSKKEELQSIYLVAEINRQLGKYREASKWMQVVIHDEEINKYQTIKKMAKEQMIVISEAYRKSKKE